MFTFEVLISGICCITVCFCAAAGRLNQNTTQHNTEVVLHRGSCCLHGWKSIRCDLSENLQGRIKVVLKFHSCFVQSPSDVSLLEVKCSQIKLTQNILRKRCSYFSGCVIHLTYLSIVLISNNINDVGLISSLVLYFWGSSGWTSVIKTLQIETEK